jgi:uncharacterized protein YcnI
MRIKRLRNLSAVMTGFALLLPAIASAHVIVTPSQAGIGQELVFNVSCPNEQQTPIVKLTLDIPKTVTDVVPTEKDGWTITTATNGSMSDPEITAITWTGTTSNIPVGQREDFGFGAQLPGTAATVDWKAYQTYADGTVVHWDQKPAGSDDASGDAGPYSVTKVVNDLTAPASGTTTKSGSNTLSVGIAILALIVSVAAILRRPASK